MRKLQCVLLAVSAAAVIIGTSRCSAFDSMMGGFAAQVTAGNEEGELTPDSKEEPAEVKKKMTVDDVVEKVSDAFDEIEDIQMDMKMSLDLVPSGSQGGTTLNMPVKMGLDMEVS